MANAHRFTVGDITCAVLHEGASALDLAGLKGRYPGVAESDIIAALDGKSEAESHLNCLYIESNDTKIVADVGFGAARRPPMGNVEAALANLGVQPAAIDIVFLTHFHGDHIIGLLDADGNPSYPNARYVTAAAEWNEWLPRWEQSDQDAHKQLYNMMKGLEDKFSFVNDGDEVADGVSVVLVPGHTMGQAALLVESNGEQLIHLADVLHNTAQFAHTDWHFAYDSDGDLGVKTRNNILRRCANENLLTLFYHLPFPGLGYVVKAGDAFAWQPIEA